jgi:hypothetical protein
MTEPKDLAVRIAEWAESPQGKMSLERAAKRVRDAEEYAKIPQALLDEKVIV